MSRLLKVGLAFKDTETTESIFWDRKAGTLRLTRQCNKMNFVSPRTRLATNSEQLTSSHSMATTQVNRLVGSIESDKSVLNRQFLSNFRMFRPETFRSCFHNKRNETIKEKLGDRLNVWDSSTLTLLTLQYFEDLSMKKLYRRDPTA